MLAAILLVAAQGAVDYQTTAKPLASVLQDLSETLGIKLQASGKLAREMLAVSVHGVQPTKLREKMAESVCGKWSEKDGTFTLGLDEALLARRRALEEKAISESILEGRGPRFPLRLPKYDQATVEKWAQGFVEPQAGDFLCEAALRQLDLTEVLRIPLGERRIYSTAPNRWQLPISGMAQTIAAALAFHNDVAEKAATANVNEPAVGTPQYATRSRMITKWAGPIKVVMIVQRDQLLISTTALVVDGSGKTITYDTEFLPIQIRQPELRLPAEADRAIELSPAAKALSDLMSVRGRSLANDGRYVVDAESLEMLRSPSKVDPLSLHYSEQLLGLAKNAKWNLVAHVRDEMVPYTTEPLSTTNAVAQAIQFSPTTNYDLKDNWLCVYPSTLNDQKQIDRQALQSLLEATKMRAAGLFELATIAAACPDPANTPVLGPYLHLAHASTYGGRMWYDLRFLGSLPTHIQELAAKGGEVSAADLGATHADALRNWAFYARYPDFSVRGEPNYFGEIRKAEEEPTEVMPNGIPAGAILRFVPERDPAVLTAPAVPNAIDGSTSNVKTVAFFKLVDPIDAEGTPTPRFEKFWIGDTAIVRLLLQPTPSYVFRGAVVDWKISLNGEPVTLTTAPKDFREAYDKALKEAIARRGGG